MEATVSEKSSPARRFEQDYAAALGRYLSEGGEAPLQQAYELGRLGLTSGEGVLAMALLHHAALAAVLRDAAPPGHSLAREPARTIERAGEFFAEAMSPFEMTHRAIGEANAALRRLNEALEEQVQRIALALHDDAGQLMVAVHLSLDETMREMPPGIKARMSGVKALLSLVEERIRDLSHELRPAMLDHLGLVPAVEFLAANLGQRTGLQIKVESTLSGRLPPQLAIALYRIIQEALANVRRHARATRVRIHLSRRGNTLRCTVSDNGVGFDPAATVRSALPGLGLLGIRERLNALGGTLRIQSGEGRGTRLEITAPLQQVEHADSDSPRRRPSGGA
ncbi:MAG TPA: sensor histidine kinase [Terracidiphilus sp.]|jgi:signal transduction histidine kinase|nr:sensor histidine kinase [Terracidiphilus sp.]